MIRKLIQLSPSTAVVSLPSSWLKANNLKKGAELFLEESENTITISAKSSKIEKEITLDISKLPERLVWMDIDAAYVAGYDSIIVNTRDQEQAFFMSEVVRNYPGLIIDEERKNKVHFRAVTETEEVDLGKILSRIFNLNIALMEDAIEGVKSKDWPLLEQMKKRDYIINSYVAYCQRNINKFGASPFSKTGAMHSYVKVLEIFSDKLCYLFVGLGTKKIVMKDSEVLTQLLELYRSVNRLHFGFTQEKLIALEEGRKSLLQSLERSHEHVRLYVTELCELLYDLEELETQLHT